MKEKLGSSQARLREKEVCKVAVITAVGILTAWSGFVVAATMATIPNPPATLLPGETIPIEVRFTRTGDVAEKRVIVRLDLHSAATGEKVAGSFADNNRNGYTGNTGQVTCYVKAPHNASGSYYFKATVSPWSLNRAVLAQYKSYPTDGTFTYKWDGGYGVTRDIFYKDTLICPSNYDNTCYCSGLAFETFIFASNQYNAQYGHSQIGAMATAPNMQSFRRLWYGTTAIDRDKLAAYALPQWDAGIEITDWEEAQEGDFVQLWRNSGSGHNPVFVNWVRDQTNTITGVHYWGTQSTSDGIGYNTEFFGTAGSRLDRNRFYLGRARKPRDQADYEWELATTSTANRPTAVGTGVEDWLQY